jgi:hypothetical protein
MGVVRPGDRIPTYRLDMSAKPPGIGALAAYWREPLRAALPDRGLVLDLRSGSYAAAWQPRRATHLVIRAFTEAPDGKRTVISHMVKRVRGEVARLVLQAGGAEHPEEIAQIATAGGMRVELLNGALNVIEYPCQDHEPQLDTGAACDVDAVQRAVPAVAQISAGRAPCSRGRRTSGRAAPTR